MHRKIRAQDPQQPDQVLSLITGALAVDVFGLVLAPSFLRAICSIPSFGNSEIRCERLLPDTNKNTNKRTAAAGAPRIFTYGFKCAPPEFS
jgi:hypothetical protein